jgi:hypothetical protein
MEMHSFVPIYVHLRYGHFGLFCYILRGGCRKYRDHSRPSGNNDDRQTCLDAQFLGSHDTIIRFVNSSYRHKTFILSFQTHAQHIT